MNASPQSKSSPIAGLLETGSFAGLARLADKDRLQILSQEQHLQSALSPAHRSPEISKKKKRLPEI